MKAAPVELVQRAQELRAEGLGYQRISRALGIPRSTVYSWLNPGFAERMREASNAAKRRRTGACVDCGATTRYGGKGPKAVSARCPGCAAAANGAARVYWTEDLIVARIREWVDLYGDPPAVPDWSPTHATDLGDWARLDRFKQADGHWPWFTIVVYRFGTWNAAITAAGFTPRVSGGGNGNILRRRDVRRKAA